MSCHSANATYYVPGMFVVSVIPGSTALLFAGPAETTDHRTPFELRWGGWFVTGTDRANRHMGNNVVEKGTDAAAMVTPPR